MKKKPEKPKTNTKPKTFKIKGAFSDVLALSAGKTPTSKINFLTK